MIAEQLAPGEDYSVDRNYREITLKESGQIKVAELSHGLPPLWKSSERHKELLTTALMAREFYLRDKQYVIDNGKIVIVDEFTGRAMPDRSWRQGLHQMIEAREQLTVTDPSETLARLSFQRFFRFFRKIGGMTGTAQEAANELWQIYALPVFSVPTNLPCKRQKLPAQGCVSQKDKWARICLEIKGCREAGQPVLIGTRSIATSQHLAKLLDAESVPYQLLNAVNHGQEAEIIAAAGQRGKVTIATNMAGRGADIKLGEGVASLGGLHVIISERHESSRIDRQLYGRCARQGDPGSWRSYICMDDEVLQQNLTGLITRIFPPGRAAAASKYESSIELIVSIAQQVAQKKAFKQRQAVMQNDDWLTEALSFARSDPESRL